MKIIGLTGKVSSGKNLLAEIFAKNGAVIFDADKEVHELLSADKLVINAVKKSFPESFLDGKIDRRILGNIVFLDKNKLQILEKIIHPEVRKKYQEFLTKAKKDQKKLVVLNIPLLLESKGYKCDYVVAITTKKSLRKQRFIAREKIKNPQAKDKELDEKFRQITKIQMSDLQRKKYADFVFNNDGSKADLDIQVENFLKII